MPSPIRCGEFDDVSDDLSGEDWRRIAKDCEKSNLSQSLVVPDCAPFHGVLAETPERPVSSLQGGCRRFKSCFAHSVPYAGLCVSVGVMTTALRSRHEFADLVGPCIRDP